MHDVTCQREQLLLWKFLTRLTKIPHYVLKQFICILFFKKYTIQWKIVQTLDFKSYILKNERTNLCTNCLYQCDSLPRNSLDVILVFIQEHPFPCIGNWKCKWQTLEAGRLSKLVFCFSVIVLKNQYSKEIVF